MPATPFTPLGGGARTAPPRRRAGEGSPPPGGGGGGGGGGGLVALKVLRRHFSAAGTHEARLLGALNARAVDGNFPVVRLLDAFDFAGHACLALEYLGGGSLLDFISEGPAGGPAAARRLAAVRKVAMQLMQALLLLREAGVVHGDLKPENVLLCGDAGGGVRVRVVDFGSALLESEAPLRDPEVQSLQYRAPEVVRGGPYGRAIDAWSTGCILAECALRRPLFACDSPEELAAVADEALGGGADPSEARRAGGAARVRLQAQAVRKALNVELPALCPALADLVRGLLRPCARRRLGPLPALFHPFFAPLFPLRSLFCSGLGGDAGLAGGFAGTLLVAEELEQVRGFGTWGRGRFGAPPEPNEGADPEGEALFRSLVQERREAELCRQYGRGGGGVAGSAKPEPEEALEDSGSFGVGVPPRRAPRVIKLDEYEYDGVDDEELGSPAPPVRAGAADALAPRGGGLRKLKRKDGAGPAAGAGEAASPPPPASKRRAAGGESPAAGRQGRGRSGGKSPWWMA